MGSSDGSSKKSLIRSVSQQIMLFTKPTTIIAISFLLATLIYSPSSTFDVLGEIKESGIDCIPEKGNNIVHCCYKEYDSESGDTVAIYCATCYDNGGNLACDAYDKLYSIKPDDTPPTPPTGGKGIFGSDVLPSISPDGGATNDGRLTPEVLENLPLLEQVPTTPTPPPLFGRNIPQGGGFEILQDSETPPMFGQATPEGPTLAEEGEDIQQRNATFPTPQPFPPPTPGFKAPQTSIDISPDLAPEDDQDETDNGRNDIIPDTGITEQPETQQPEDSSEGAETAGPLT